MGVPLKGICFQHGENVLFVGAEAGHYPQVAWMIEMMGLDVNSLNDNHVTPLMRAVFAGKVETTRTLLALGANPKLRDNAGEDALDYARKGLADYKNREAKKENCGLGVWPTENDFTDIIQLIKGAQQKARK
jgi:hypothetical protein